MSGVERSYECVLVAAVRRVAFGLRVGADHGNGSLSAPGSSVEPSSASVADQRSTSVSSLTAFESPERLNRFGRCGGVNLHHRDARCGASRRRLRAEAMQALGSGAPGAGWLGAAGLPGDVHSGPGAELGEDVRDVGLDGAPGQQEFGGYVRVGPAVGDQPGDAGFGGAEGRPAAGGRVAAAGAPAAADAERAQPGVGAAEVPVSAQPAVDLGCLEVRAAGGGAVFTPGE